MCDDPKVSLMMIQLAAARRSARDLQNPMLLYLLNMAVLEAANIYPEAAGALEESMLRSRLRTN